MMTSVKEGLAAGLLCPVLLILSVDFSNTGFLSLQLAFNSLGSCTT